MLDGKQVALKKPLAVLQSSEKGDTTEGDGGRCFKVEHISAADVSVLSIGCASRVLTLSCPYSAGDEHKAS
jgi:hypothetical protein